MNTNQLHELAKTWMPPHELGLFPSPRPVRVSGMGWLMLGLCSVFVAVSIPPAGMHAWNGTGDHGGDLLLLLVPIILEVMLIAWVMRERRLLRMGMPFCGIVTDHWRAGKGDWRMRYTYLGPDGHPIEAEIRTHGSRVVHVGSAVTVLALPGSRRSSVYPLELVELAKLEKLADRRPR